MCDVVTLPINRRAAAAPRDGDAEILFFTGVRYERMRDDAHADGEPPQEPGGARGRRRGAGRSASR